MKTNVRIQSIVNRYPEVERIFEWYDIELTENVMNMKLEEACDAFQIEAEDLILDLEDVIYEVRNTEWLSNGEPQWTEGFTEETDPSTELSFDDDTIDGPTGFTDDMSDEDMSH